MEDFKWDTSASSFSISSLPWGSVWTMSIQTLTKWDRHTLSALLLMGSCILHGVTAPNLSPRHAAGKPTNCNMCCACEFLLLMPQIISHILGGTCWMKCKHSILAELLIVWLSHCCCQFHCWHRSLMHPDCIPTCDRVGHQGTWQANLENVFLFCRLLFIFGYCGADGGTLMLFKCIVLFCSVQHYMWRIWNWIYYLITDTVFVLVEIRDRE